MSNKILPYHITTNTMYTPSRAKLQFKIIFEDNDNDNDNEFILLT